MQCPPLVEYIVCLLLTLLLPLLLIAPSQKAMNGWYGKLHHSRLELSKSKFFSLWTLQYVLMGTAMWAILEKRHEVAVAIPVALFLMIVALNVYWLILLFIKRRGDLALVNICAVWMLANFVFMQIAEIEPWAALLLIPYLLWLTYAFYLNISTLWLNREFWCLQRIACAHAHARAFMRPKMPPPLN